MLTASVEMLRLIKRSPIINHHIYEQISCNEQLATPRPYYKERRRHGQGLGRIDQAVYCAGVLYEQKLSEMGGLSLFSRCCLCKHLVNFIMA